MQPLVRLFLSLSPFFSSSLPNLLKFLLRLLPLIIMFYTVMPCFVNLRQYGAPSSPVPVLPSHFTDESKRERKEETGNNRENYTASALLLHIHYLTLSMTSLGRVFVYDTGSPTLYSSTWISLQFVQESRKRKKLSWHTDSKKDMDRFNCGELRWSLIYLRYTFYFHTLKILVKLTARWTYDGHGYTEKVMVFERIAQNSNYFVNKYRCWVIFWNGAIWNDSNDSIPGTKFDK